MMATTKEEADKAREERRSRREEDRARLLAQKEAYKKSLELFKQEYSHADDALEGKMPYQGREELDSEDEDEAEPEGGSDDDKDGISKGFSPFKSHLGSSSPNPRNMSKKNTGLKSSNSTKLESKPRKLYNGSTSRNQLTRFQESWRKCLQLSTWSSEEDQVVKFGGFLSGDALAWWTGIDKTKILTGEDCLTALRQEFDLSARRSIYTSILSKKRHRGESSLEFIRRIIRLINNRELTGSTPLTVDEEADAVMRSIKKFPKSEYTRNFLLMMCRDKSLSSPNLTFNSVKDYLVEEAKQQNSSDSSSSSDSDDSLSDSSSDSSFESSRYKTRRKSSRSKFKRKEKTSDNSEAIVLALQELRADLKTREDVNPLTMTSETPVTEKVCTGCKRKGHTIERCYKFGPVCDKCRFRGHPTETCRAPACPRCPGKYHFFRLCPVLKNEETAELLKSQKN